MKTIKIEGMTCGHCAGHVKKELEAICGVSSADVSADKGTAVVELAHDVEEDKFKAAVEEAGYEFVDVS
ncbi:MAG: hypothetical protein FH762_17780 [Firmicutes bacterium]|nr:hypothetical protein [Bacillota bacterium]